MPAKKTFLRLPISELIEELYREILKREPHANEVASKSKALKNTADLVNFIKELCDSDEYWNKLLADRASELVESIYKGILGRSADPIGLKTYSELLVREGSVTAILTAAVGSAEFRSLYKKSVCQLNPANSFERDTVVFLHIQKTAGTSVQNMLTDNYEQKDIYREHADTLYQYSPAELSAYSVFSGHFNYDSLAYIPRKRLSIFTFVREPKERLISLYYFWRAHEPSHNSFHVGMKYANDLAMDLFFDVQQIKFTPNLWNHMTCVVMGYRQWKVWQDELATLSENAVADFIETTARPAIRKRLVEFIFIGLQEDFDASVRLLFYKLKKPQPINIRADHSVERLMKIESNFKKNIERQVITEQVDALLNFLVSLDSIVYEEAKELYHKQLLDLSDAISTTD